MPVKAIVRLFPLLVCFMAANNADADNADENRRYLFYSIPNKTLYLSAYNICITTAIHDTRILLITTGRKSTRIVPGHQIGRLFLRCLFAGFLFSFPFVSLPVSSLCIPSLSQVFIQALIAGNKQKNIALV